MEILQKFKEHGYFTAELYHLLAKKKLVDPSEEEILPSDYEKEMRMTTQQRLQNLNNILVDNITTLDEKKPKRVVLSFSPRVLVFQNFKPNDKIVAKFSVKNISKAPTFLNMVYKESSYFFVKPCGGQLLSRLAPGISFTFAVTFMPVQYEDYTHRVTFFTDTDQYVLPLIAMGPRPVFDFPDEIVVPKVPLKVESSISLAIHNVGSVSAGFTLKTKSPVSIQPKSAYLNPGEKIDIRIGLKTMYLGETQEILYAVFETGEKFKIKVKGSTYTVSVELEKYVVRFNDTFKTMIKQQTLKVTNKSNHLLTYMCMKNDTVEHDYEEKFELARAFYDLKDIEAAKSKKLVYYDVLSSEEHQRVYMRIFFDEIQSLVADETLQFQNMHFSITPNTGNLWPNKVTEITITFAPKEIGDFTATAFLDIDGVINRIPLSMKGTSLPPAINLNLETLDMDQVYINKTYHYEIVAINKGHINGVIVYKDVPTLFGSRISCCPEKHCLRPDDKKIFVITFCNSNQGPYFEEINFIIRDTNVVLKLYLKGEVIYPSLTFSVPCLDFGMVSLGVPKTLSLDIINESVVDVNGYIKISSDGPEICAITLADYAVADIPKPQIPQWPRELSIVPSKCELKPESRISLQVTLTANLIRANQTSLELELEKSDSPPVILPIIYNARIPELTPAPEIKLRACFLDFPYHYDIQITCNEFWGYFSLEDSPETTSTLDVEVGIKEGLIKPNSTTILPVTIKTSCLGLQECSIRIHLFGKSTPIEICKVTGIGVRPIVTCVPMSLHWGQVKLLNKFQKTLTLCNDSPVVVKFKAFLLNKDGRWQIEPSESQIEPESETDILLTLYLVDADTYTNKAVIQMEKVKDILVPLTATGVGTSIVVGDLRDRIHLGKHFTKIPLNCKVVMENCGTRLHSLEWSEHYKAPKTKQQAASSFFSLEPKIFKIAAGEKIELTIIGLSYKVTTIKETWYLVGSVEGINKKELLLECDIVAEFVDPKIEMSSSIIEFQYDCGPYSEHFKLTDIVTIKNISKLPLDFDITVKPPFAIIQKQSTYKISSQDENLCCCICYSESDLNVSSISSVVGVYQSRTYIDYLTLKPVEPLRNCPLNFFQDINKLKMAFNLTHSVEERLEDKEVMKLQILFDTTKHCTLKSRIYSDIMRVKFKGHKNKDGIKLIGHINFPNMFVLTPRVDFHCLLNGSIQSKTIKVQNVTPLLVCYRFQWKKCMITTTEKPQESNENLSKLISETPTKESEITVSNLQETSGVDTARSGSPMPKLPETDATSKEAISSPRYPTAIGTTIDDNDVANMKFKIMKKISPMIDIDYEREFDWIYKFPKLCKHSKININDVLQLTPHRGLLKPNEIQYVHVIFRPTANINVRAILECEILGGPPESIIVTGQSSDLRYTLNTQKVNFKIRSFHEDASEEIIISNIAQLPFDYKTYVNEPKLKNELEGTILDLIPPEKNLEHEEEAQIKIVVRPGVVGYFNRVFLLEIAHLPHIPIEVFGWGVFPQVHIALNRPDISKLDPELGYRAISSLTMEYLEAVSQYFELRSAHLNTPLIDKCFEDADFQHGWHICSSWDGYPSVMDIELAIERVLVIDHIKLRPDILTAYLAPGKMSPIPGFYTTPYVIDYGVVITDSTVQCVAEVTNYGPIPVKLHFAKGTHVPSWLSMKLCGRLMPGESGKMEVIFSPTSEVFVEKEVEVETSFNLEVPYGITMPIQIKALCAVPYLTSNVHNIDFGSVRCGDKIVCSIPLKNIGKPTCIWYVTLRLKAPGTNPMMVMDSSGKYEPGESGWLSVAFKPTMEMKYEGLLVFRFHMNTKRMTIPVSGQGIVPHVHIIGPNVCFPPTLPWAQTTEIYFGLTNPCPFPIELIMAHSDQKWKDEDAVFQFLYKYYNRPEEMLVPAIKPGAGMPPEIVGFYKKFKDEVKRLMEGEAVAASTTSKAASARAASSVKGKSKTPKTATKSSVNKDVLLRKFKSEAEIVADVIQTMKENHVDPLRECLHVFDHLSIDTESDSKGLIVVFHGSPHEEMQCQELAYSLGMNLDLPTVNFDHCIVEALCVIECDAKTQILTSVHESYDMAQRIAMDDNSETEHTEEALFDTEDEFDTILKKIQYLSAAKNLTTPRSKFSEKKKKKASLSSLGSRTALASKWFQLDLIQQLLTDFFHQPKFSRGFVIDSLTSLILKNPPLVLTTILKCKHSIWNVHLVLCNSDFSKWAHAYEEAQKENEILDEPVTKDYDEKEIEEIIKSFDDMDEEEFEKASPELKSIYIIHGLENRRKKHIEKMGIHQDTHKKEKNPNKNEPSKSQTTFDGTEKKKTKKDDTKSKPTPEYLAMNARYNEYYKTTYESLINIANNWKFEECDVGAPLYGFNGQVLGVGQKKTKKKSEVHLLQVSETSYAERGFPITLIMCPCRHYKDGLLKMFKTARFVQEALKVDEEHDILKCPVERREYTVLLPKTLPTIQEEEPLKWRYLDETPIKKCECNQLTDLNLLDDTTQDNVLTILSKWHCTCAKKLASSQTSTSEIPSTSIEKLNVEENENDAFYPEPMPLRKVKSLQSPQRRIILQPGDLVRCKYSFSPEAEGNFNVKRFVEVSGWPDSRADINVSGICDLPRLDSRPKKMFENFVRRTIEDNVYKSTYLEDQKMFEFGPIFVGHSRIYEEEYSIDLRNSSLITANVVIEFLEDTNVFHIDKTSIILEPGCRGKLTISAAPAEVGGHKSVLLFCVKDNPEIVTVTVGCNGVVPHVEILPLTKTMEFGKLLLYRREDDRFIVKNDSILPIMWKIRNANEFVEDFIITHTSGLVQRQDNQIVPVTYIACRVGTISRLTMTIDIYDELGRGSPMVVDNLYLSAECYDVMVECAYDSPTENYLNYGNVKVNSNVSRDMYLLNRGKYNIYYKLKKVKNFPEPSLLKSFEAFQECGVIPPSPKLICIEFSCTPTTSINLVNVPAYICSLVDGSKDQVVVAKFPVCVTIASFYNTFTLFPLGELNFHIIPVGSGVMREVILNNTSKCPVTYEIVLPPEYQPDPDNPPVLKLKDNKIKTPPLRCGNFMIYNEDNLLAPGTSRVIQIQFLASAARKFEETIHFIISDTCPAEAEGVPLKLVGTGAKPKLDFWNVETTFREHLIVKNLLEYKVPESSPHCVFVENSVTMHFFCVNVNTSHMGSIDLYNNGLVACALTMKLHHQANSNPEIFSLDKYETHIEPLLHKNLGIIFSPKALEEYRAVLEIKLKLLDNQTQSFKVCLIGEGVIPRIELVSPPLKQYRIASIKFPVTCLGSINTKNIRFRNTSTVNSIVTLKIIQSPNEERPIFWLTTSEKCEHIIMAGANDRENIKMRVMIKPRELAAIIVHYNPIKKGKSNCEVKLTIRENPYEYFAVICEAEAFMEDVILVGLEMLPMDVDLNAYKSSEGTGPEGTVSMTSMEDSAKKSKTGQTQIDKKKVSDHRKGKRLSVGSNRISSPSHSSVLKYILNFGGCELYVTQKRTVSLVNNSEKVYKFNWENVETIVTKPSTGYISPSEEKDIEIMFFAGQPVVINKDILVCNLTSISEEFLTIDKKGTTWDNRQMITTFDHNTSVSINERLQVKVEDENITPPEAPTGIITLIVVYSAVTEYTKYTCALKDQVNLRDTFIYQTRTFDFDVTNVGNVPMKISWSFIIDDEYPARIDKDNVTINEEREYVQGSVQDDSVNNARNPNDESLMGPMTSKITLFSGSAERDSVDTWFEINLPFEIEPERACLKPKEVCSFRVTFSPLEAFDFKVKLRSTIENLDPYDQNIMCKLSTRSLIPYVHLDIEESDYLTSGRRKPGGITLPKHTTVLEFNVLGWGCYKKSFNVINPTNQGYEFIFEMVLLMKEKPDLVPVHCNMLKGYAEGGTSTEVTFTFAPTAPGVYESQWKFIIPVNNLLINLLVVGVVREPDVTFVPTILVIRNSLVGFTTANTVMLKNSENENLKFEFKGNSLCNESGKTPVVVEPDQGTLKARSETPIKIIYTPIQDGPLSFKIFCSVTFMMKFLTLCVNALSYSVKPKVTYYLIGNEHALNSEAITNIYLDQTASTYERTIPFKIRNDGSATFFFEWHYVASKVKKYLKMSVEPKNGHVSPGKELECILYFTLKQVPVRSFPVTLTISDGPEYNIYLYADIEKPAYHFSCMDYDFGKCFVNAPDDTYKKNIAFINDDEVPVTLHLNFTNIPELYADYQDEASVQVGKRLKLTFYFRPKQVREYEFKLQFWVNSLCEEIITLRGEGIPPLFDLYEGCQKSFDLGPVKIGEKIVRTIEVINFSKIPIDASFIFRDMYPVIEDTTMSEATSVCLGPAETKALASGEPSRVEMLQVYKNNKVREQISMDTENALSSLKVVPNKCKIMPYGKAPLKIQFKPIGLINNLDVQLNMKVLSFEKPLVKLSGSATGMSLCLSQSSLQFGRVRKRGCKILKVMLLNNGDFGARFWWQPLISDEFKISPLKGNVAAHTNVTFTITFRPINHNPFIKVWASCNIENYKPLELAMYATCVDLGNVQNHTLYLSCPVREVITEYIAITNPSDETWLIVSEISGGSFETLKEFNVEANSTFEIPVHFKPKVIGKHEAQVLYSPLGESALFVTLVGAAGNPNPNGSVTISTAAKEAYTEELLVYNITENPETYMVSTEMLKISPDKFEGYYEINHTELVKVWGEATATCRWTFVCYEECEMQMRVNFVNELTREYQFYMITATVTPSRIVDTLVFSCRARETARKDLVVKNPLATDAVYLIQCACLKCPDTVKIGKCSEAKITMEYSPLVVGVTEDRLEVSNGLAGSYVYKVVLKCLPAKEKELEVSTPLGTAVPMRLRVHNNTSTKTEFTTTVSHSSIQGEREYTLGQYEKGKFLVWFEPTELGIQKCKVSFNSVVAGEFVFDIKGIGADPKPQGPYKIKAGGWTTISFKNVFDDTRVFRIHLDTEEFYVKSYYETVKGKKDMKVTVFLNDTGSATKPTGSLCIETEPPTPKLSWTYFLQGI